MPRDEVTARAVGGRYELRELLGRGGMGSVWRGEDLLLQRPVAVKQVELPMHLPEAERSALRQRVMREARAAARVSHPRLVTIFDVVEEGGTVFLVQELVDAPTLKHLVAEQGPMSPAEVAMIGRQLVDGLAAAHRSGVVHRDVKPSNVMVGEDGSAKLTDFGIASVHGDPQLTATGVVIGSPAYMAPEQATGAPVTPAADLWSLGATLYFAVEGEPPFGRADTISTLTAVVNDEPRQMTIAGALAPVLTSLLSKTPEGRPDAATVGRLLDEVSSDIATAPAVDSTSEMPEMAPVVPPEPEPEPEPVAEPVAEREPEPVAVAPTRLEPQRPQPPRPQPVRPARSTASEPPSRGRGLGIAIAVVLVLLAGGFAIAASLANRDDDPGGPTDLQANDEAMTTTSGSRPAPAAPGPSTSSPSAAGQEPKEPAKAPAAVPADWKSHQDPDTGYVVAYPPTWRVQDRSDNRTDFTDPATGTYLRVDWTDKPGESAEADWERQSKSFGERHENYREIRIDSTRFSGSDNAALWEYSYTAGGASLHAYNLAFVLGDDYGFALNFQTREENWAASQPLWEQLKAGYRPPPTD